MDVTAAVRRARREVFSYTVPNLPEGARRRLVPEKFAWGREDELEIAVPGNGDARVVIAPANHAAQGYYWAHAASELPGVSVVNLRFLPRSQKVFGPSDFSVDYRVGVASSRWARRQLRALSENATHVLLEASKPLLGGLSGDDLARDVELLQSAGLKVGFISHGSDVRIPSVHSELSPHSPFRGQLSGRNLTLETRARTNNALLDAAGLPEFVSTPDLLLYRPDARLLPVLAANADLLTQSSTTLGSRKPVVLHFPSSQPALKATGTIDSVLSRLQDEGVIEYRGGRRYAHREIPQAIAGADVVVNQMGLGPYGVAETEAMLAGKLVISDVWDCVRSQVFRETGRSLPILQADPGTLENVVREVAAQPEKYAELAADGPSFVRSLHTGERVRDSLASFLLA